jgi:hypothetical protein
MPECEAITADGTVMWSVIGGSRGVGSGSLTTSSLRPRSDCLRRSDIQDVGDRTAQTFGEVIGKIVAEARHHI